jgi:hypothetical protein
MKATRNFLSHGEAFRLFEWVRSQAQAGALDRLSMAEVASLASDELGFTVSVSSVKQARKVTGAVWKNARVTKSADKLTALEEAITRLESRIAELERRKPEAVK